LVDRRPHETVVRAGHCDLGDFEGRVVA
jgi:hypothetical protein